MTWLPLVCSTNMKLLQRIWVWLHTSYNQNTVTIQVNSMSFFIDYWKLDNVALSCPRSMPVSNYVHVLCCHSVIVSEGNPNWSELKKGIFEPSIYKLKPSTVLFAQNTKFSRRKTYQELSNVIWICPFPLT